LRTQHSSWKCSVDSRNRWVVLLSLGQSALVLIHASTIISKRKTDRQTERERVVLVLLNIKDHKDIDTTIVLMDLHVAVRDGLAHRVVCQSSGHLHHHHRNDDDQDNQRTNNHHTLTSVPCGCLVRAWNSSPFL
jgi:hypothetical protein